MPGRRFPPERLTAVELEQLKRFIGILTSRKSAKHRQGHASLYPVFANPTLTARAVSSCQHSPR